MGGESNFRIHSLGLMDQNIILPIKHRKSLISNTLNKKTEAIKDVP